MNFFEAMLGLGDGLKYEEYKGEVFFDNKTKRFLQLRGRNDDYLIFGGFTLYYGDAKTHRSQQQLSYEYAKGLIRVTSLDTLPGVYYDGIGWKMKGEG